MWGNVLKVLKMYTWGNDIGKKMQKEKDCWSFVMKESCAWQALGFIKQTKGKLLMVLVDVKQKLILCLWGKIQKVCKRCESDSMETSAQAGGRRSREKGSKKIVRKQKITRRKIWKLDEDRTTVKFENRVKDLVSTDAPDLWKTFKDGVLKACDEVCGKKKFMRDRGDIWWWDEEIQDTIARKKVAFKKLCKFPSKKMRLNSNV